jgi:hypothetical protein
MYLTKQEAISRRSEELRKAAVRATLSFRNAEVLECDPVDAAEACLEHWATRNIIGEWGADLQPNYDENYPDA